MGKRKITRRTALKLGAGAGLAGLGLTGYSEGIRRLAHAAPSPARTIEVVGPTAEPPSLDPGVFNDLIGATFVMGLFEGLVSLDRWGNPRPQQAEKWEVSADGRTYTFRLREGIKWSDGKPVTARDYEYGMKRALDPETKSLGGYLISGIAGGEAFSKGQNRNRASVGVRAQDDRTVVVRLERPTSAWLSLMSLWPAYPIRQDIIDAHKDRWTEARNIVSNGPYRLESWRHDSEMVMVASPTYWGRKPAVTKATFKIFAQTAQTTSQMLAAYEAGEVDWTDIPGGDRARILNDPRLSRERVEFDLSSVYMIVTNCAKAPFSDVRVRQALYLAIDPMQAVAASNGPNTPADTFAAPGLAGRNPTVYQRRPNVEQARRLLADAGFPGGRGFPEFTYATNASPLNNAMAAFYQQAWRDSLNLNVRIQTMDFATYGTWRRSNPFDVIRAIQNNVYDHPAATFNDLLESTKPSFWMQGWKNDEYDKLVQQGVVELNSARRRRFYEQADAIVARELPFIPVFYQGGEMLVKPKVRNVLKKRIGGYVVVQDIQPA
jgi:oligopeptide transport system substrate-binding protein